MDQAKTRVMRQTDNNKDNDDSDRAQPSPSPRPPRSSRRSTGFARMPVRPSTSMSSLLTVPIPGEAGPPEKVSVLFCCLGNICRSTMAEGVFRSLTGGDEPYAERVGRVDSCGTGAYHTGDGPDDRTMSTLESHGIADYRHAARKVSPKDLDAFDYVFAMDQSNLADLERLRRGKPDARAKVMLFGEFSGTGRAEVIDDPYYGGAQGFEKTYEQAVRFSRNFLRETFPDVKEDF